jgi:hypothetical protein
MPPYPRGLLAEGGAVIARLSSSDTLKSTSGPAKLYGNHRARDGGIQHSHTTKPCYSEDHRMALVSGEKQILSSFEGVDTAQSTVYMMLLKYIKHSPKHICHKDTTDTMFKR